MEKNCIVLFKKFKITLIFYEKKKFFLNSFIACIVCIKQINIHMCEVLASQVLIRVIGNRNSSIVPDRFYK